MNKAKLTSVSHPLIEGINSAEELITYYGRVSNPTNQMNTETAPRLLKYLIRHQHWSPFETVSLAMEIETTRDIARQILRHRSFSFQEFSQRYAQVTKFTTREARLQDSKNRQNSLETNDSRLMSDWKTVQMNVSERAQELYQWALDQGIAKEQARALLPEGLTVSTLCMAGTVRSWIHYIQLRTGPETQKEHREVALSCREEFKKEFPVISEVLFE